MTFTVDKMLLKDAINHMESSTLNQTRFQQGTINTIHLDIEPSAPRCSARIEKYGSQFIV